MRHFVQEDIHFQVRFKIKSAFKIHVAVRTIVSSCLDFVLALMSFKQNDRLFCGR